MLLILTGILISFLLIIFLIRKKFNFGLSLISGALILGLFSLDRISFFDIFKAFSSAVIYSFENDTIVTETLELAILMTLIYMLAKIMQDSGAISHLIYTLRHIFSKGGTLAVIPAIYGLMPVPGGALFSAPVVKEEGDKFNIDKNKKNFLNVWFRHIWFPIYPLSSNIIVITSVKFSNIEITKLIEANLISFASMILVGLVILRFTIKKENGGEIPTKNEVSKKDYSGLKYLMPPIVPLFFGVFYMVTTLTLVQSFIIGIATSIVLLFFLLEKTDKAKYVNLVKKAVTWKFALVIFGIMIFREIFEASEANLAIFNILKDLPIPIFSILIILPIILGLISGYLLAGITLSYPLLVPFFPLTNLDIVGLTSLIFMGAFVGYLISPIHLCNVLSSDYLKTDTTRMYKTYIPSATTILIIQIIFLLFFYTA
ncbi:MAG: DUF401 family protein [Candidatus Thermoplasmatota archaeon]